MPIWIIVSYKGVSVLSIFSVVGLYGKQKKQYAKSALSTYIFFTLVFLALWMFRLTVPSYIVLLSMLTVLSACFLGHYLEYYMRSKTFDRHLHALGAFSFALLSFCILDDLIDTASSKMSQACLSF